MTESTVLDSGISPGAGQTGLGQTFTVPTDVPSHDFLHTLSITRVTKASGTVTVIVSAVDGGGLPTGPALFTSAPIATPLNDTLVTLYPNISVTPGQKYAWYVEEGPGIAFEGSATSTYTGGTAVNRNGVTWAAVATFDIAFRAEFSADRGVTTTTVSNCVGPITIGVTTSCRATVTNNGPGAIVGTPTGQVTFDSIPSANAVPVGSCALTELVPNVSGQCDYFFTPGTGSSGSQTVNGNYATGDATHLPDGGSTSITVNKRTSEHFGTSCIPATISLGQSATCSATIADNDAGTLFAPAGNVTWNTAGSGSFSPSASCALAPQTAGTSSCSVTYTPSVLGSHAITSSYAGGTNHLGTTPAGGALTVTAAVAPVAAPDCSDLLSKLKKLKRKLRKAESGKAKIRKKIRKTKQELAARGC